MFSVSDTISFRQLLLMLFGLCQFFLLAFSFTIFMQVLNEMLKVSECVLAIVIIVKYFLVRCEIAAANGTVLDVVTSERY